MSKQHKGRTNSDAEWNGGSRAGERGMRTVFRRNRWRGCRRSAREGMVQTFGARKGRAGLPVQRLGRPIPKGRTFVLAWAYPLARGWVKTNAANQCSTMNDLPSIGMDT